MIEPVEQGTAAHLMILINAESLFLLKLFLLVTSIINLGRFDVPSARWLLSDPAFTFSFGCLLSLTVELFSIEIYPAGTLFKFPFPQRESNDQDGFFGEGRDKSEIEKKGEMGKSVVGNLKQLEFGKEAQAEKIECECPLAK
ncbi:hypothetical protein T05_7630 [Trichinella murrelli]|uniref:Uncharacterized protein n=1 Tax=Trichinella murrelli TaxID=144512 RepID=A0A0V0U2C0_9BILA|nr:hypothetical protein T05_7630 [Trichinella murrelli]